MRYVQSMGTSEGVSGPKSEGRTNENGMITAMVQHYAYTSTVMVKKGRKVVKRTFPLDSCLSYVVVLEVKLSFSFRE
jgi:hypothetical protein